MRTFGSCRRWALALLVGHSLSGCAGPAHHQKAAPQGLTERQMYEHARSYFAKQRYRDAADLLEFIYEQNSLSGLLQNIGTSYLRLAQQAELDPILRLCYAQRAHDRLSRLHALDPTDGSIREQLESARALGEKLSQRLGWASPPVVRAAPQKTASLQLELPPALRPR